MKRMDTVRQEMTRFVEAVDGFRVCVWDGNVLEKRFRWEQNNEHLE